ncbi:MAG TPA: tetratricopeptide repeat protein [Verrucomicrobiae bacterium]|nr:tetratricopeptide repeat protein [Verrucomicrobiae bacterium]
MEQQQGSSNAALSDYGKAIELTPDNSDVYSYHAYLEQTMGKTNAALADYDRLIELDPHSADGYLNRSSIEGTRGDLDRSEADCGQIARLDPKMSGQAAQGFRDLGDSRFQRFQYTNALTDFRKACELDPSDDYAYIGVWLCSSSLGNLEGATKELKASLTGRDAKNSSEWPSEVERFLVGSVTEQELLSAARNTDVQKDKGQHFDAYYYIGSKRLLAGEKAGATAYFEKCLSTGMTDFWEYRLATAELQTLKTNRVAP